ncbi:hypothetical protein GGF32_008394 [Allomyces javanicus]|nr:hypothetical protein GGF32_008394 [Allomyces javanicus]
MNQLSATARGGRGGRGARGRGRGRAVPQSNLSRQSRTAASAPSIATYDAPAKPKVSPEQRAAQLARQKAIRASLETKRAVDQAIFRHQVALSEAKAVAASVVKAALAQFQPHHWDESSEKAGRVAFVVPKAPVQDPLGSLAIPGLIADDRLRDPDAQLPDEGDNDAANEPVSVHALATSDDDVVFFCSRACALKSKFVRVQLDPEPIYLRGSKPTAIILAEEAAATKPTDPIHHYVAELLHQPLDVPIGLTNAAAATIHEHPPAASPSVTVAPSAPTHKTIEGYTPTGSAPSRTPVPGARSKARVSPPASADPSAVPSAFTMVMAVLTRVVTPATRRFVARRVPAPAGPAVPHKDEDGPIALDLDRKLQVDLFFDRYRSTVRSVLGLLALPAGTTTTVVNAAVDLAMTFRITAPAVTLLIQDSVYSWLFVLVCIWGACTSFGDDGAAVLASPHWETLFGGLLSDVGGRPVTVQDAEYMATVAFADVS